MAYNISHTSYPISNLIQQSTEGSYNYKTNTNIPDSAIGKTYIYSIAYSLGVDTSTRGETLVSMARTAGTWLVIATMVWERVTGNNDKYGGVGISKSSVSGKTTSSNFPNNNITSTVQWQEFSSITLRLQCCAVVNVATGGETIYINHLTPGTFSIDSGNLKDIYLKVSFTRLG